MAQNREQDFFLCYLLPVRQDIGTKVPKYSSITYISVLDWNHKKSWMIRVLNKQPLCHMNCTRHTLHLNSPWPTHSPSQATNEFNHSINAVKAINIAAILATSGIACEAPIDAASTTLVASSLSGFRALSPRKRLFCSSGYKILDIAKAPGANHKGYHYEVINVSMRE